jgi:hypothetical protein
MLFTALLGSHRIKDGVDTVRRYEQTQEHHAHWHQHFPDKLQGMGSANVWEKYGIPELTALPRDHNFIDAIEVLIGIAAEGRLIRELGEGLAPFDNIKIIAKAPRTHARITMSRYRKEGGPNSVQADYGSNAPPAEWVADMKKDLPPQPTTIRPKLDRWAEMNAMPIIYVGALLAGKLDELPKLGRAK